MADKQNKDDNQIISDEHNIVDGQFKDDNKIKADEQIKDDNQIKIDAQIKEDNQIKVDEQIEDDAQIKDKDDNQIKNDAQIKVKDDNQIKNKDDNQIEDVNHILADNQIVDLDENLLADKNKKPEEEFYEHILEKSTFTRHRLYIIVCMVFIFIANGMEMTIFNFIIQPFGDYFDLDESDIETQVATSSLFLGIGIGCASASFITNKIGRIYCIRISNLILFISHLTMSYFLNLYVFIISRCIIGLALGVIIPIFMNIYGEYCPAKYRGFLLMVAWSFYGIGQLITNLIGFAVMPKLQGSRLKTFLLILLILPFLSLISCLLLLNDSPRGLLLSKRIGDESKSLAFLNKINERVLNNEEINEIKKEIEESAKASESLKVFDIIREMFNPELKKTTILMVFIFISLGYNAFGIYAISSYFLDYLDEKENGKKDDKDIPARDIIINQIMYAVAEFVANILGGIFGEIPKLGRKGGIMLFTIFAATFTIIGLFKKILFEVTSPISSGCTTIYVNLALDYVVELYPTKIRDSSTSLLFMIYRVSSFLCNFISMGLYTVHKFIPYFIYSGFAILLCILTWLLPYEMAGKKMK